MTWTKYDTTMLGITLVIGVVAGRYVNPARDRFSKILFLFLVVLGGTYLVEQVINPDGELGKRWIRRRKLKS